MFGGSNSIYGGKPIGDGGRFDPEANRWHPLTAKDAPSPRYGAASAWTGTEWWILGGAKERKDDALNDAFAWHPKKGWRALPNLPEPRADAHAFATKDRVVLIGGRDAEGPCAGGFVWIKKPTSRPKPR